MRIFLSWSGNQSHLLAQAFKEWLPEVIQSVKPFLSSKDIYAGVQWFPKLKAELEAADFGIVCLTRSNLTAPYIMLESGAMGMRVEAAKLVPVLCDLSETELGKNPLTAFNYVHLTEEGIWRLAESINNSLADKVPEEILKKRFDRLWPELRNKIKTIIATPDKDAPAKKEFDVEAAIEQIYANINALAKDQSSERLHMLELTRLMLDNPALRSTGLLPRAPLGFSTVRNALLQGYARPDAIQWAGDILSSPDEEMEREVRIRAEHKIARKKDPKE